MNLAAGLAEQDKSRSVALVDMNLNFGEVQSLDIKSSFDWGEVIKNIYRVDGTFLRSILSEHPSRISVLASPAGVGGGTGLTPETLEKLLEALQESFDFTVVDGGQAVDESIPQDPGNGPSKPGGRQPEFALPYNIFKKLLWTFQRLGFSGTDRIWVVINRYQKNSVISLKEAEQSLSHKISGRFPTIFRPPWPASTRGKSFSRWRPARRSVKTSGNWPILVQENGLPRKEPEKEKIGFWGKRSR